MSVRIERRFARILLISATVTTAAFAMAPAAAQRLADRIDNLPMYGQPAVVRPEAFRVEDDQFIADAMTGFETRRAASDAWWRVAESFVAKGNFDLAMRRYNQAWLLDRESFRPYWGFARVVMEMLKPADAQSYFERAIERVDSAYERPALLTDAGSLETCLGSTASGESEAATHREKARSLFQAAIAAEPDYGNAYKRWAMLLFDEKKYGEAWTQVKEARKRPRTQVPAGFIAALQKQMKEPE